MAECCSDCGAPAVWDDNIGSAVCTSCGNLEDPSQSVLTSAQWSHQNDTLQPSFYLPSSTTLKALRQGNNWDLPGQGKESRDRKNLLAIADFIKSLAVSLNASGLSPRAITLFTQAKAASSFRWGKKSRSAAGACLAIALREANRPDSLRDIAAILSMPPTSLTHAFISITSTLGLTLSVVDPAIHISTLQTHLTTALRGHNQELGLPTSLVNSLQPLNLHAVAQTAAHLSALLARLCPNHEALRLPAPPTACGIFILALEAENRALLNPLGDLAQYLGARCHVAKGVVMARYKMIQDEAASWVEQVPWLDRYESKKGRAKVAKRLVVARGLKDVINFQEGIWRRQAKPVLQLDFSDDESDEGGPILPETPCSRKRAKMSSVVAHAAQFLENPLAKSMTSKKVPISSYLPVATYLLTSGALRAPSRLQLLALDRGGVGEDQIPDDDLFEPGELEKLLRTEEEVGLLREHFGWNEEQNLEDQEHQGASQAPKTRKRLRKAIDGRSPEHTKKSRLNLDALAQFLSDSRTEDGTTEDHVDAALIGLEGLDTIPDEEEADEYDHISDYHTPCRHPSPAKFIGEERSRGEIILDGWRPPTPEGGGFDSRYEEEYD